MDSSDEALGALAILGLIYLLIYFVPTITAVCRKAHYMSTAILLNIFLGWTFIGWVLALILACMNAPANAGQQVFITQVVDTPKRPVVTPKKEKHVKQ